MKSSHRIIEKVDLNGEVCYIPQHKKLWFWFNYYDLDCLPKLIKFYSLSLATNFVMKQKFSQPKKIHYL